MGKSEEYGPYDYQNAVTLLSEDRTLTLVRAKHVTRVIRRRGFCESVFLEYEELGKATVKRFPNKERAIHELSCGERVEFMRYSKGNSPKPHTAVRMQVPKHMWAKVKNIEKENDIDDEYRQFLRRIPHLELGWWDDYCRRSSSGWKHNRRTEWKRSEPSYKNFSEVSGKEGNVWEEG